jgi:hypothetical protein
VCCVSGNPNPTARHGIECSPKVVVQQELIIGLSQNLSANRERKIIPFLAKEPSPLPPPYALGHFIGETAIKFTSPLFLSFPLAFLACQRQQQEFTIHRWSALAAISSKWTQGGQNASCMASLTSLQFGLFQG